MRKLRLALITVLKWLLVLMLLGMTVVLFAQITFRYFFHIPFVWSEELAIILMLWLTFLGTAVLMETDEHISIDFFIELFPSVAQHVIELLSEVFVFLFNIGLVYGGYLVVMGTRGSITPGMKISVAWHYGGVVVGGVLLVLVSIERLLRVIKKIYGGNAT